VGSSRAGSEGPGIEEKYTRIAGLVKKKLSALARQSNGWSRQKGGGERKAEAQALKRTDEIPTGGRAAL